MKKLNENQIQKLINAGFNLWEKNGFKRLYANGELIDQLTINLKGGLDGAFQYLEDEEIDRLYAKIYNSRPFFDLNTLEAGSKFFNDELGSSTSLRSKIIELIKGILA